MEPDPYDEPDPALGSTTWLEAGPYRGPSHTIPPDPPVAPPPPRRRAAPPPHVDEPRPLKAADNPDGPRWLYAPTVSRYLLNGLIASVIGTVILGIVLQAMGLLTAIADSADVSVASVWFVLFVVHILLGFVFGFVLATVPRSRPLTGIMFGLGVWILWGMIALPVWLDQSYRILDFSENEAWALFIAYLAYGFTLGLVAWYMEPRDDLREVRGFRPAPVRY